MKKSIIILAVVLTWNLKLGTLNCSAQNVGINTTGATPNNSALLDLNTGNNFTSPNGKGLLIPCLTTTQRNAIPSPVESLLIYNTDTKCFEAYNATTSAWVGFGCIGCTLPAAPTTGTHVPSATQIVWNWNTVSGATGYKYNTANNYGTATDNLTSATYTQTGLTCGTAYSLYVWAYNACGNSTATTLTQTTSACLPSCGTPAQVWASANMNTGTQVTQATTQAAGQKWCYNDVVANCTTYGGLYQWASALNVASTYNSTSYTGSWATCDPCGSSGILGICPAGYHIPTDLEWSRYEYCLDNSVALNIYQTTTGWRGSATAGVGPGDKMKVTSGNTPAWDGTNTSGFSALPAGDSYSGTSYNLGSNATFWPATEGDASNAWFRYLYSGYAQSYRFYFNKTFGFSVRCLQN